MKNGERIDGDDLEFLLYEGVPDSIRGSIWPLLCKVDKKDGEGQA